MHGTEAMRMRSLVRAFVVLVQQNQGLHIHLLHSVRSDLIRLLFICYLDSKLMLDHSLPAFSVESTSSRQ